MWQYNVELFQWINGFSQFPLIRTIAPILADLPIFFLPIFLTFYWLYYTIKKMDRVHKENILFLFYAPVIAIIISLIIQSIVHFERPETATVNKNFLLLEHIPDASFPSDHTSVGVAFLLGLYFAGYKRTFWAFFPWVILMCVSRVIS